MKKIFLLAGIAITVLVSGCSHPDEAKRVVVMASGKVSAAGTTITLDPSLTHNELDQTYTDNKLALTVKETGGDDKPFEIGENGVYVLNLQHDTLIGSLINYGEQGRPGSITVEMLDHIIDSTRSLMAGTKVSPGTFFIPPFTLKKVSDHLNTKIIGAFKGIPYTNEPDNSGRVPDVIKFFTNKQKRESLQDLEDQKAKLK